MRSTGQLEVQLVVVAAAAAEVVVFGIQEARWGIPFLAAWGD